MSLLSLGEPIMWICPVVECEEENIADDGDVGAVCSACGVYVSLYVHPDDMPRPIIKEVELSE